LTVAVNGFYSSLNTGTAVFSQSYGCDDKFKNDFNSKKDAPKVV
jgi:hypothetical protein